MLNFSNHQHHLIVAYGKGKIAIIDVNFLFMKHFSSNIEDETFKKSANIQRPIKENFVKQIEKSQIRRTKFESKTLVSNSIDKRLMKWDKRFHKDSITHLDIF